MGELNEIWDRAAGATEIQVGDGGTPSGEERMIAAATYLLGFIGFWLIGALFIYFWQRKRSAYIAHHAVQSVILQIWIMIAVSVVSIIAFIGFIGTSVAASSSYEASWLRFIIFGGMALVYAFLLLAPLYWQLRGAWAAAHGELYYAPVVGKLAQKLVTSPTGSP